MHTELRMRQLREAHEAGEPLLCIHYACENLYEAKDHPAAVACIAVTEIGGSGYTAWSPADFNLDGDIAKDGSDAEREILRTYCNWVRTSGVAKVVHWNMSSSDYGFEAIENRCRYIGVDEVEVISRDRLYDMDDLIAAKYGERFADHPKMYTLAALNGVSLRHAMKGEEEAEAATRGDHAAVKRSTADKVKAIASLTQRFVHSTLVTKGSAGTVPVAGARIDVVDLVLHVSDQLLYVARELGHRHGERETIELNDEYDTQDLFRSLLRLFFKDIRSEEWSPSYAGSASRIDFVLPAHEIAIELKHARGTLTDKNVGGELVIDAAKYAEHPNVRHLVCIVFDHEGQLRNPRGLEADVSENTYEEGRISVAVRVVDR